MEGRKGRTQAALLRSTSACISCAHGCEFIDGPGFRQTHDMAPAAGHCCCSSAVDDTNHPHPNVHEDDHAHHTCFIYFAQHVRTPNTSKRTLPRAKDFFLHSGICIYYWITRYYCKYREVIETVTELMVVALTAGAIIFTIIAILSVLSYFGFRSRIPLASLLLQVVVDISKHHISVYVVAFVALFLQAGWNV